MAVIEEDNKQVFQPTSGEDVRLENLGYEQGAKAIPSRWTILT
jgi:choline transport protein